MAGAYQVVIAHDCHNTQRLHANALRLKGRAGVLVAKDDVGVDVGIEVLNSIRLDDVLEGSLALTRGVIGAFASLVVGAVTVDIHVSELLGAGEVDEAMILVVSAVGKASYTVSAELILIVVGESHTVALAISKATLEWLRASLRLVHMTISIIQEQGAATRRRRGG